MVGVCVEGIPEHAKEMSDLQKWDMNSFAISDEKIHSDEKDVIVASYLATLAGTFEGKGASGLYNAGTIWRLENGK